MGRIINIVKMWKRVKPLANNAEVTSKTFLSTLIEKKLPSQRSW